MNQMEQEKNKRAREYNDFYFDQKNKKRDVCSISSLAKGKEKVEEQEEKGSSCCRKWDWDSPLAMGVFDFPWLKDGVISKTEREYFEDNFLSSSLQGQDSTNSFQISTNIDFFEEYQYALCEAPMVVEDLWKPFEIINAEQETEAEDLNCIWSSLNQPL